jgi:hypothetical protein
MVHFEKCYKMGKKGESEILPILKEYFKRDIQEYPEKFSKYDFFDDIYEYECKTRRNTINRYDTTMITSNKLRDDKPLILLFNYTDCIGYIEYNKDKFNKYQKEMFSRAGISEDEKNHVYIPISDLIIIHRKPVQQFPSYNNIHYLFSDA